MATSNHPYHRLRVFLRGNSGKLHTQSRWFQLGHLDLYVRAGGRFARCDASPNGIQRVPTVVVSNVKIDSGRERGRGHFRNLMVWLQENAADLGYKQIMVENVLNPTLLVQLQRHGYVRDSDPELPCLFYTLPIRKEEAV